VPPYRTEYTYFSDRLFVLYRPADLHKYLGLVLQLRGSTDPNEEIDRSILPYVLLHRSRLHPFDLRRQLARMRNSDGTISLPSGVVRTELAYRFDVLIQVAVEWLLDQPVLRERLNQDEDFTQSVYDTLYYPSRMWEQGQPKLDVSSNAFFSYLGRRMSPTLDSDSSTAASSSQVDCPLSALDKDFLFARLRQLVVFLKEPAQLLDAISGGNSKRFPTNVLDALPVDPKFKLLDDDKTRGLYVWRYDIFGRSVEPPGVEVVLRDLAPNKALILDLQNAVSASGGPNLDLESLATTYKILNATPAWTSVQDALRRLQRLRGTARPEAYAEMEADSNAVWEFSQMLRGSGTAIAAALVTARLLGQVWEWSHLNTEPEKIRFGLWCLSNVLVLDRLSAQETKERLHRVVADIPRAFPWFSFDEASFDLGSVTVPNWSKALRECLSNTGFATVNRTCADTLVFGVEKAWHERFLRFFHDGTTSFEPVAEDLVCGAARIGLTPVLSLDLNEMSLAKWSELLVLSLAGSAPSDAVPGSVPAIFGFPPLFELGFGKDATDYVNSGRAFQSLTIEIRAELEDWVRSIGLRRTESQSRLGILVIVDPTSTLTNARKPSPTYAAIVITPDKLAKLRQALQGVWRQGLISRIVAELNPTLPVSPELQSPLASLVSLFPELATLPYSYISAAVPPGPLPPGFPVVIAPKSVGEAIERISPATPQPRSTSA
jgi:hypothetical protein